MPSSLNLPFRASPGRGRGRPGRPRAREALVERATGLFFRFGIRAVSVDAITTACGLTKPSFYRRFISKDELIIVCLAADTDRVIGRIAKLAQTAGSDPGARMQAIADGLSTALANDELGGLLVLRAAVEFPEEGHPVRLEAAKAMSAIRGALREALGSGRPEPHSAAVADCVFLVILGAFAAASGLGPSPCSGALSRTIDGLRPAGPIPLEPPEEG